MAGLLAVMLAVDNADSAVPETAQRNLDIMGLSRGSKL